jgi:hypothetical protein
MTIHRSIGDYVNVVGIDNGIVVAIREDSSRRPIYTVQLDNPVTTPTGIFYARAEELRHAMRE